ncbi:MAG TPA: dolichyl-phosphate beta-glucosyltransferase [Gemmataceae bacterium]|nr:dolichyl-phosphate beta-glucosyltransferase [Gemmataceae bacterium]
MFASPYLSVIVPAYNEVRVIGSTLRAMREYLSDQVYDYEIIVAADGNDGTRELVAEMAQDDPTLGVLGSPHRGGKGRGIRQAVARARGQIIGFVDADYKTPIEEIEKVLPWFDEGYDLAFGSRGMAETRIENPQNIVRRLGSRGFKIAMQLIVGLWGIADTQCGFKFYRAPVARDLFRRMRIDGYMFDVDLLYLAKRTGYRMKEVGIRWRDDGDSRLELVAGNWQNLKDLFRIRLGAYPPPFVVPAARALERQTADVFSGR